MRRASIRSTAPLAFFLPITSSLAQSYPSSISSTFDIIACAVSSSPSIVDSSPSSKRSITPWFAESKKDILVFESLRLTGPFAAGGFRELLDSVGDAVLEPEGDCNKAGRTMADHCKRQYNSHSYCPKRYLFCRDCHPLALCVDLWREYRQLSDLYQTDGIDL